MFSFFKKKDDTVQEQLAAFQEKFTKEQRAAILGSLVSMAQSDGEAHPKELQLIERARKLLGVELADPTFSQFLKRDKEFIVGVLNTLERVQKEWFIASLHSIILADGKVEESETTFMKGFCEKIGISEFDYLVITHK